MKIRLIALFLLLALALTGCTPALRPAEPETTLLPAPTEATEAVETEKPTEAQTEATETATEATEAPTERTEALGVDLGTVDGRTYRNESLGISASFPEGWYIYTESDIADLNNFFSNMYDNAAVYNAIEEGQYIMFFCASHLSSMASVNIGAMKNYYSYLDEKTYVEVAVPQTRVQLEQLGGISDVVCEPVEVDFCGQKHTALSGTYNSRGYNVCETTVYLFCGELVYTLNISATKESTVAEILSLFGSLG